MSGVSSTLREPDPTISVCAMKSFLMLVGFLVGGLIALAVENSEKVYTAAEAAKHVGETVVVTAHVDGVRRMDSGLVLVNLDGRYPHQALTAVVRPADAAKVGDLTACEGKTVRIRGKVVEFRGRAEIEIKDKADIRTES